MHREYHRQQCYQSLIRDEGDLWLTLMPGNTSQWTERLGRKEGGEERTFWEAVK